MGTLKLTDYVDNSDFRVYFILIVIIIFGWEQLKVFWLNRQKEKILQDTKFPFVDIIGIREGKDGSLWISTRKQGVYNAKISL